MKIEYIKANGRYYKPQVAGVRDKNKNFSNYPVCIIKKLFFGRWRIDFYCENTLWSTKGCYSPHDEDTVNKRIILYPSGIEEISYLE